MKILAIRGRNLASLEGDFEVRFDAPPLRDAGIFAIGGPTGAGKSTLLDALCLALYDRTPRLDGKSAIKIGREGEDAKDLLGDQDTRSLLRRGAAEGRAEVDFVGRDGRAYRATWSARRARERATGRFQQVEVALADLATSAPLAGGTKTETLNAIAAKVGLPFEQFRRSVLLAQGDFAAFLKASAGERADLLERMTGTEIYARLSVAAFERARAANERLRELEVRIGEAKPLEAEARAALVAEQAAAEAELGRVRADLEAAQAALRWHAARATLAKRATDAAAAAATAERAWTSIGAAAGFADAAARAQAEADVERLRTLDHDASLARAEAAARRAELATATTAAQAAAAAATKAATALRTLETRIREGEAFAERERPVEAIAADWTRLHGLLEDVRKANAQSLATERELADVRTKVEAHARAAAEAAGTGRLALEAEHRRAAALDAARDALAKSDPAGSRAALDAALTAETALLAMTDAAATAAAETKTATDEGGAGGVARAEAERHAIASREAGERARLLEARLSEARAARERDLAARDLTGHRAALVNGEPCPLCGAREHPFAVATPAFDAALRGHDARLAELERDLAAAAKAAAAEHAKAEAATRRAAEGDARAKAATSRAALATARWHAARATAAAPDLPTSVLDGEAHVRASAAAAQSVRAARARVAAADAAQQAANEAASALEAALKAAAAANARVATLAVEAKGLESRRDELAKSLACSRRTADDALTALDAPLAPLGAWRTAFDADPSAFTKALGVRVDGWRARTADLKADRSRVADAARVATETAASAAGADGAAALARTRASEADAKAADVAKARAARFGGRATADVERTLAAARHAHDLARERARDLADHDAGGAPAFSAPDATARAAAAEARRTALEGRLGELRQVLGQDDALRRRVEALRAELDAATAAARVGQELSELIGSADGKKFRVYAQSLTLEELVASANMHLLGLRPRYRLERVPTTDLDLQVVDRDLGDEVRAVASLSGGETFLVSLALALGLSSLAAQDVRLDSLFVDEGFGTLDPDTLESALAVLDALQAEGRQVGLISHVPGLAERLGARVEVVKVGAGTSRVRVVAG